MIDFVDKLYKASAACSVDVHAVNSPLAKDFSLALRQLQRTAFDLGEEDVWAPLLRHLKSYRYRSASVPLPFHHPAVLSPAVREQIHERYNIVLLAGGSQCRAAAAIAMEAFRQLSESSANPLGDTFYKLAQTVPADQSCAAVLLDNNLVSHCNSFFSWGLARHIDFLSPFDLRRDGFYDRLFVFGPPYWYHNKGLDFLFHAPRSPHVDVITFRWINNRFSDPVSFPGTQPPLYHAAKPAGVRFHAPPETEPVLEDPSALLPQINLTSVRNKLRDQAPLAGDDEEEAQARLLLLSGNKGVFVEISDSATSFVIDLSAKPADADDSTAGATGESGETDADTHFGRKLNADLEPGTFLLLRTEGGGDLVQEFADRILAATPEYRHELQAKWKQRLAETLRQWGPEWLLGKLQTHGGKLVTVQTVRNWKTTRNVRPDSPNFEVLLGLLGLANLEPEIAANAQLIRRARMQAGMHIRRLLLDQIKKADLSALAQQGSMTFHLQKSDAGGSMTAFRIEKILPDLHTIPYNQLGHPIDLTDDLWQ